MEQDENIVQPVIKRRLHSEETKRKIGDAHRGRKRTPEEIEKNRIAHIGLPSARKGAHHTEEAKQKLREARANQIHPLLAAQGVTKEQILEAIANDLRWCGYLCKAFIPKDRFGGSAKKLCGECRECIRKRAAESRARITPEEKKRRSEIVKRWRSENPEYVRRKELYKKYGVTPEWFDETLAVQGGGCAICGATNSGKMKGRLCVDHDHGAGKPRGILCTRCNNFIGQIETAGILDSALLYLRHHQSAMEMIYSHLKEPE